MNTLDLEALEAYLSPRIIGLSGLRKATKFSGGQSNPTFLIEADSGRYVLRRKPPGKILPSAHAVDREYRVIAALAETDVPVAPALHLCEDDAVIGSAFYVMGFVDGVVHWDPALPDLEPGLRRPATLAMIETLARLHSLDPAAVGLADYGRPAGYAGRQIARWTKQYQASAEKTDPHMEELIGWLHENQPAEDGRASIVHGDYRIDNLIYAPGSANVRAVLDWELSTIGHPFADIAYVLLHHKLPRDSVFKGLAGHDRDALGLPHEAEIIEHYCNRLGVASIDALDFWVSLSAFRLATILEGVAARIRAGNASDPERGRRLVNAIPDLIALGLRAARRQTDTRQAD
ncbi:MAG: phosphotransferase family protein [Oricola sp.]|nr:MAG: phosphotransferase family protein [Oricola sp.]